MTESARERWAHEGRPPTEPAFVLSRVPRVYGVVVAGVVAGALAAA
jgi:hypothetical protein